jgi:LDH2 family malate/lactate/ureidoglycolate dehydrogenase
MDTRQPQTTIVGYEVLLSFVSAVLATAGVSAPHAATMARLLVDRERCGYDDHGLPGLGGIVRLLRAGQFNPTPNIRVVEEGPCTLLFDADSACGVLAGAEAMARCIAKASQTGFACAGVRRSGHFFAAGSYAVLAAEAGMIGFAASNTDASMAPVGGLTPVFGTNPLAYALPAGRHVPVVLDMATSTVSRSKIVKAAREGSSVPPGLIEDLEGRLATTPGTLAGEWLMVPLGGEHAGAKGFGLALVVDALCGVLTGGAFGRDAGPRDGQASHFFWALDPGRFLPREEFLARMDAQIDQIKASRRREGVEEVLVPGERGQRRLRDLRSSGEVPLSAATVRALQECAEQTGVPLW